MYDADEGIKSYVVIAGVPQGSISILWNAKYDGVSGLRLATGEQIFVFMNDIALAVRRKHLDEMRMCKAAIGRVRS